MRVITAVLALAAAAAAEPTVRTQRTVGNYTGDYYKGIDASKSGDALRQGLGALIFGTRQSVSYKGVWNAFRQLDEGIDGCPAGKIRGIYSDYCWSESQQCGNYKKEGDCFNREHIFPKSWFGGMGHGSGAGTDLFELFPADGYVNNLRGNYPLGPVPDPRYVSTSGAKLGACGTPSSSYSGDCFEIPDAFKGDVARAYLYLSTAYYGKWTCCETPQTDKADMKPWELQIMLDWHAGDPVDDSERAINEEIFTDLQKNRNPYIDHPEWARRVFAASA
eukprot:TRINITY_DN77_c0_g1_i2.p1 TRINITY_DN77_c0_g1~~TRINITY_DN77_c0_g1_i2.p1  ORF type:complete len:311 (-),score=141.57 TRINITY_DN77_c0_g1_i2:82-912(-)